MIKSILYFFLLLVAMFFAACSFGLYRLSKKIPDPINDIKNSIQYSRNTVRHLKVFSQGVDDYFPGYQEFCSSGYNIPDYSDKFPKSFDNVLLNPIKKQLDFSGTNVKINCS